MRPQNPVTMKTSNRVLVAVLLATTLMASTERTWSASARGDLAAAMNPACCNELPSNDQVAAASVKAQPLVLTANNTSAQFPVAVEVTRLIFRESPSLLTSAATTLKPLAFGNDATVRHAQALGSLTNNFARLELQTTDAQSKETKPFPLEFSGQTDIATRAADRLSVPRDFTSSDDALISDSKATGFSFAFSRSARSQLSAKAKAVGETGDWRVRATPDFSQFAKDGFGGGENWARREPQGLRFFSWRW